MRIFKVSILIFCIIILLSQNIYATSDTTIGEIFSTGSSWLETGRENAGIGIDTENLRKGANDLYNTLLAIATGVAVIVGAILGIKIMTSSIEEKAKVKEALIPYIISCIVVFGSLGIWKLTILILKGAMNV